MHSVAFAAPYATCVSLRSARLCRATHRLAAPPRRVTRCSASSATRGAAANGAVAPCERLAALRAELARRGADALIVPSADAHASEYPAAAYARRAWLARFTGSAGTAVVTAAKALLWTDGRYFAQAERELSGEWTLMRAGERDTPTVHAWLAQTMPGKSTVAIDPFVHTAAAADRLRDALKGADVALAFAEEPNPVDLVWGKNRPKLPTAPVRMHPARYAGMNVLEKIEELRERMKERDVSHCLLSMLDEVCWLFNIRGGDVDHCPVVLSYALVGREEAALYVDVEKMGSEVRDVLSMAGVHIVPYERIVEDLAALNGKNDVSVWLDPASTSVALRDAAGDAALCEETPVSLLKAVKNQTEIAGMRAAHIRDGAALSKFLWWIERYVADGKTISEVKAAEKLEEFRAAEEGFIGTSFGTIAGAGGNGAIIHYSAKEGSCAQVSRDEVFLLDSGGQYCDGTTDVTRTMHLGGTPTEHEKTCFTRVLQGHIAIDSAVFPEQTTGFMLDTLARVPLWSMGLDYRHGTGHGTLSHCGHASDLVILTRLIVGVGACLNVHEGPQSISSRISSNRAGLRAGMILSNEPGYYESGNFGIRIENLLVVVEKETPFEFGGKKYLGFERLTFVPIDKSMIAVDVLNQREIEWVDEYHQQVWTKLGPLFDDGEFKDWLREKTLPLVNTRVGAAAVGVSSSV